MPKGEGNSYVSRKYFAYCWEFYTYSSTRSFVWWVFFYSVIVQGVQNRYLTHKYEIREKTVGGRKCATQFNTLRPKPNGYHFPYYIFKCVFLNKNCPIEISPEFVPKGPIIIIAGLFHIMAWRRPGDKPLFEQMMVTLPTHMIYASIGLIELTTVLQHLIVTDCSQTVWLDNLIGR